MIGLNVVMSGVEGGSDFILCGKTSTFFHIRSSFQSNRGVLCSVLKFNLVISVNTSGAVEQETRYTHTCRVSHVLEIDQSFYSGSCKTKTTK